MYIPQPLGFSIMQGLTYDGIADDSKIFHCMEDEGSQKVLDRELHIVVDKNKVV